VFQSLEHQLERQKVTIQRIEPEKALFCFWRSVFREKTRPPMKHLFIKSYDYRTLEKEVGKWLKLLGYSKQTAYAIPRHLREFFYFLEQQSIHCLEEVSKDHIEGFLAYLQQRENLRRGGTLSPAYLNKYIQALNLLSRYVIETSQESFNLQLKRLKKEAELPLVLRREEIARLYKACEATPLGIRDKAMLSVYYGCGARRSEGVALNVADILFDRKLLYIRKGKGNKERYVPMSGQVQKDLRDYLYHSRPLLIGKESSKGLFLNYYGKRLQGQSLHLRFKLLLEEAGIKKESAGRSLSLHSLRHSIATHLLQSGMPLKYISHFLGHSSLESTQIYTHLKHEQL
jgi:integrase/recombinase XerD